MKGFASIGSKLYFYIKVTMEKELIQLYREIAYVSVRAVLHALDNIECTSNPEERLVEAQDLLKRYYSAAKEINLIEGEFDGEEGIFIDGLDDGNEYLRAYSMASTYLKAICVLNREPYDVFEGSMYEPIVELRVSLFQILEYIAASLQGELTEVKQA